MSNLYHHSRYAEGATEHLNEMARGMWRFDLVPICGNALPSFSRAPWCEIGVD